MDEFKYGGVDQSKDHHAMMAIIDSGNTSIQIPQTMFTKVIGDMRQHEISVHSETIENRQVLVARRRCEDLYDTLQSIEFILQGTSIKISPRGYLYRLQGQDNDCFIGIESIPDSENHYRLGRIFLRNFYTTLDFDKNLIMLGVNARTAGESEMIGHTTLHPYG